MRLICWCLGLGVASSLPRGAGAQVFTPRADSLMDAALTEGFRALSLDDMASGRILVSKMTQPGFVWVRTLYTDSAAAWSFSEIKLELDCFNGRTRVAKAVIRRQDGQDSAALVSRDWSPADSGTVAAHLLKTRCHTVPTPALFLPREREPAGTTTLHRIAGPPVPGVAPGQPLRLTTLHGRIVVLELWAPQCGYCGPIHQQLITLLPAYLARNVVALSIPLVSDSTAVVQWLSGNGGAVLPTLLSGRAGFTAFPVNGYPRVVVIDTLGRIAFDATGGQHDYRALLPPVLNSLLRE